MNIFESLIEELKEENLLEQTVIETSRAEEKAREAEDFPEDTILSSDDADDSDNETHQDDEPGAETEIAEAQPLESGEVEEESVPEMEMESIETAEPESGDVDAVEEEIAPEADLPNVEAAKQREPENPKPAVNGVDFYRQRAMKEVSGLQMVEHVISGVEREQMKVVPKTYDDLEAKKILHTFLQVSGDMNSPEHAQAEFKLMQETESWYSALSHRDKNISVSHLRRYCETSRPILSSQALISIARFYRNSPYSEAVRSKFDLIITRLFAKDIDDSHRKMVFERLDMIKHLTMLYAEWASVPLYSANEDDSEILLLTLKFEDFMTEADNADSFDELIKNDFFDRLRQFKESTNENFFAPLVTSTAIECNVRVGNRYVELLQIEKEKADAEKLEQKYGFLHDHAISEAASKSLHLLELLSGDAGSDEALADEEPDLETTEEKEFLSTEPAESVKTVKKKRKKGLFAVNKWLLITTILVIAANVALYIWASSQSEPENLTRDNVKTVNLENSALKDFVKEARIANDTFTGLVQGSWSSLKQEKKEEVLKKIYSTGAEKGFTKVHLLNNQGKSVGYADAERTEIY